MCTKLQKQPDKDSLLSVVAGGMTLGKLCDSQCPPALQELMSQKRVGLFKPWTRTRES